MKCDYCGREFAPGNAPDGTPNGITLILKDGSAITACAACVCAIGRGEIPVKPPEQRQ